MKIFSFFFSFDYHSFKFRSIRNSTNQITNKYSKPLSQSHHASLSSDIKSHISKYQRRNNGIFPWRERAGMESVSWKCGAIRTNTHTETQRIMRPPREICLDLLKSISKLYDAAPSVTLGAN